MPALKSPKILDLQMRRWPEERRLSHNESNRLNVAAAWQFAYFSE